MLLLYGNGLEQEFKFNNHDQKKPTGRSFQLRFLSLTKIPALTPLNSIVLSPLLGLFTFRSSGAIVHSPLRG